MTPRIRSARWRRRLLLRSAVVPLAVMPTRSRGRLVHLLTVAAAALTMVALDVDQAANGSRLILWPCDNQTSQKWARA